MGNCRQSHSTWYLILAFLVFLLPFFTHASLVAAQTEPITPRPENQQNEEGIAILDRSLHLMKYTEYQQSELGKKVASSAQNLLGAPYAWGGTGPRAFDCSGFTQYVYSQNGIKVPRNTYEQYHRGKAIPTSELRPGDLVFFSTYAPGPSHIGIYVGEGEFIHALNQERGVITSKLDSNYYKERYLGARRMM